MVGKSQSDKYSMKLRLDTCIREIKNMRQYYVKCMGALFEQCIRPLKLKLHGNFYRSVEFG